MAQSFYRNSHRRFFNKAKPETRASFFSGYAPTDLFSDFAKAYAEGPGVSAQRTKNSTKTGQALTFSFRIFKEIVGNKPLCSITRTDLESFSEQIRFLPANFSRKPELKDKTAPEAIAAGKILNLPTITPGTQVHHLLRLSSFFSAMRREKKIKKNPLSGFDEHAYTVYLESLPGTRILTPRHAFSEPELDFAFSMAQRSALRNPARFWLPVLALFTGMRLNEIAQLHLDQIQEKDGIVFLRVSQAKEDQTVKTDNAPRIIPLHSRILAMGFLEYAEEVRATGEVHLFPGLDWGNGPGDTTSRWFNDILRNPKKCGLPGELVFHSFRHTFATFLNRQGVADNVLVFLMGHSAVAEFCTASGFVLRHFHKAPSLKEKQDAIEKLQFHTLALPAFSKGQFNPWFKKSIPGWSVAPAAGSVAFQKGKSRTKPVRS